MKFHFSILSGYQGGKREVVIMDFKTTAEIQRMTSVQSSTLGNNNKSPLKKVMKKKHLFLERLHFLKQRVFGNKILSFCLHRLQVKHTSSSNCPYWSTVMIFFQWRWNGDVPCKSANWEANKFLLVIKRLVCGQSGLVSQLTRFMLRLRLRQLGMHFFSDLVPGDGGV